MYERSIQKIAEKKFYSILIDGATDSSVTENEVGKLWSSRKPLSQY